jgi:hypothetical protein
MTYVRLRLHRLPGIPPLATCQNHVKGVSDMHISDQFLWGAIGGASLEVLHWWMAVRKSPGESFPTNPLYWGATIAMIAVAGFLTQAYFAGSAFSEIGAFHVGFTTPYLLQTATRKSAVNLLAAQHNASGQIESAWLKWLDW